MEEQKIAEEIVELSAEELDKVTGGVDLRKDLPDDGEKFWQDFSSKTGITLNRRED